MQSASLFSEDLQLQAMFVKGSSDSLKFRRPILSPLDPSPDEKASLEE